MTLKEVFSKVAVAMDEIDLADYTDKIYQCADSTQREIATFAAPITRIRRVKSIDGIVTLPEDCYEVIALNVGNVNISFLNNDDGTLFAKDGDYALKYNAYPKPLTRDTPLTTVLEISKEGSEAMVYGICAGLCINDEPELYTAYMDRYNSILDAIISRRDRYPFGEISGGVVL